MSRGWPTQLRSQVGYDLLGFRRNPAATFFTVILPLIFLLLFTSIFGNETLDSRNGVRAANFYVPGILALALISATLVNLAMTTVTKREDGLLKRVRGTPLRPWVFVLAQAVASMVIATVMTVLVVVIGRLLFGVVLQARGLPALAITLLVATVSFSALGLALTTIIPSIEAAPAITNATVLPLYFISDVFIVTDSTPELISFLGNLFPVKHLTQSLFPSFDPFLQATPMPWGHWAVIAAWGAFGAVITVKRFRWTPWDG